jgi:hypothetical protein
MSNLLAAASGVAAEGRLYAPADGKIAERWAGWKPGRAPVR